MTAAHDGPRAGALRRTVVVAQAAPVIAPYEGGNNGKAGHLRTVQEKYALMNQHYRTAYLCNGTQSWRGYVQLHP